MRGTDSEKLGPLSIRGLRYKQATIKASGRRLAEVLRTVCGRA